MAFVRGSGTDPLYRQVGQGVTVLAQFSEWLDKWLGGGPGGEKRIRSFRWLVLLGLTGILFMIVQSFMQSGPPVSPAGGIPSQQTAPDPMDTMSRVDEPFRDFERALEERIKKIIERIVGVNGVEVMVTIESTEELVVYQNEKDVQQITEENDRNGARRHITEVSQSGEIVFVERGSSQQPVVLKTVRPKVSGVVVVAGGSENPTVRQLIIDAVQKGLNVPPHRISVVPGKQRR